jgi:hypothetical protein
MTRDDDLIAELTRLIGSEKVVNESERATITDEIKFYSLACKLSNGKDKQSNLRWSRKAGASKWKLEEAFRIMTGRAWFDMKRFQRCDKCE